MRSGRRRAALRRYPAGMPAAGEQAARTFAETITSGDRLAAIAVCHQEIEFKSMLGLTGVRYLGHAGINRYFDDVESAWEDWSVDVEQTVEGPDGRVAIVLTMHARGKGSGVPLAIRAAHIWTLRDGKLVRNELYRNPDDALDALGDRDASQRAPGSPPAPSAR
jgi:ketosteroid isomerase-like protein